MKLRLIQSDSRRIQQQSSRFLTLRLHSALFSCSSSLRAAECEERLRGKRGRQQSDGATGGGGVEEEDPKNILPDVSCCSHIDHFTFSCISATQTTKNRLHAGLTSRFLLIVPDNIQLRFNML